MGLYFLSLSQVSLCLSSLILMISCAVAATDMKPKDTSKTLIYDENNDGFSYYCEFVPEDTKWSDENGGNKYIYESKCRNQNPDMKMVRDSVTFIPWHRYTQGKDAFLLECPKHERLEKCKCSAGSKVYSVCDCPCPKGSMPNTMTIECEIRGPIRNVSAAWSNNSCKISETEPRRNLSETNGTTIVRPVTENPGDQRRDDIKYGLISGFLALLLIVIGILVFCKRKNPCCRSPSNVGSSGTGTPFDSADSIQKQKNLSNPGHDEINPLGLSDMHYSHYPERDEQFNALKAGTGGEGILQEQMEPFIPQCRETSLKQHESSSSLNGSSLTCHFDNLPSSCKALIREIEDLNITEFRKISSILEYCAERTIECTLYGYVLENWSALGFTGLKDVELHQKSVEYRDGDKPIEFFFKRLFQYHVHTHQVLTYFSRQSTEESKEALNVLLEYHTCEHCRKEFGFKTVHDSCHQQGF